MARQLWAAIAMAGLSLCVADAFAKDDKYNEPINAYQAEMGREPVDVRNANYFRVIGESQANRAIVQSRKGDENIVLGDGARQAGDTGDSIVNIASPRIEGNVRGNVNVIVERGAIKGSVTSIRR